MKKIFIPLLLASFVFASHSLSAQQVVIKSGNDAAFSKTSKIEEVKIYGNCGMCKKRIETAVTGVKGVTTASWDASTMMMVVVYNESSVSMDKILLAVANAGHDSDYYRAEDEIYNNLHGCCQYERPENAE